MHRLSPLVVGLILILFSPATVVAQAAARRPQQNQGQATGALPVKEPPPPLFPKHRRGVYSTGGGPPVLDAAPQSPPLEIDDPGVPDPGEFEINLTTQADLSKTVNQYDLFLVDANYGLRPSVLGRDLPMQLKIEAPAAGAKEPGQSFTTGIGGVKVGIKLNFYNDESKGLFLSFYPQLGFVAPGTGAVEKGLADAGQAVILPILVQKELHQVTLVINSTITTPIHDSGDATTGKVSVGIGRAITRQLALMTEARVESALGGDRHRILALDFGLMRGMGRALVLYANTGFGVASDADAVGHTFVGVGLKMLVGTKD